MNFLIKIQLTKSTLKIIRGVNPLVLLTDVLASLMVLISVIMTLIDVAGFMHFWGLTVDTVSAVLLTVRAHFSKLIKNPFIPVFNGLCHILYKQNSYIGR